jgi:hypothetical protein
MARYRIRIELRQGKRGIPLGTLADIAAETQKFLRMTAQDIDIPVFESGWLATDFANDSVDFNVESTSDADDYQVRQFGSAIRRVVEYHPNKPLPIGVRSDTVLQFARIAELIEPGEPARLGIFNNGSESPEVWQSLIKSEAIAIREYLEDRVEYWGMIQGIIHSLFKESQPPYFNIREMSNDVLVRCTFPASRYSEFIPLLKEKRAVVLVSGYITARRTDRRIERVHIDRMEPAPELSDSDFEKFFGSAPRFTGDQTTEEFLNEIRGDGD